MLSKEQEQNQMRRKVAALHYEARLIEYFHKLFAQDEFKKWAERHPVEKGGKTPVQVAPQRVLESSKRQLDLTQKPLFSLDKFRIAVIAKQVTKAAHETMIEMDRRIDQMLAEAAEEVPETLEIEVDFSFMMMVAQGLHSAKKVMLDIPDVLKNCLDLRQKTPEDQAMVREEVKEYVQFEPPVDPERDPDVQGLLEEFYHAIALSHKEAFEGFLEEQGADPKQAAGFAQSVKLGGLLWNYVVKGFTGLAESLLQVSAHSPDDLNASLESVVSDPSFANEVDAFVKQSLVKATSGAESESGASQSFTSELDSGAAPTP